MGNTLEAAQIIEGEPEDVGLSSIRLQNLSRMAQGYVDAHRIPGAITMVARHGKVVHFETFGNMDVEAAKPMRADTIFRLASMTKPIASVALMTLYEEGLFQLDDPASRFIPELKGLKVAEGGGTSEEPRLREPGREITIADLLRHTSGFGGEGGGPLGYLTQGTLQDFIELLSQQPLLCDPGAQWNYGISTDIIGYLCEVISGRRFDEFLQERIFSPLHMVDTGFYVRESAAHRLAASYRAGGPGEKLCVLIDAPQTSSKLLPPAFLSGAGGLLSTAPDYMRFCKMLANGGELDGERILGPGTLRFMTLNHLPGGRDIESMRGTGSPYPGMGFGLGFAVLLDPAAAHILGTPGEISWGGAYSTYFFVSPQDALIAAFFTQLSAVSAYPFYRQLTQQLRVLTYQAIVN